MLTIVGGGASSIFPAYNAACENAFLWWAIIAGGGGGTGMSESGTAPGGKSFQLIYLILRLLVDN